ncbi:styrene monooxygenase/indole monooxygenase family protein [Streptomyces olivoreticuli]
MRRILIVGAGQSGLQLALGLQAKGYDVTLLSHRTADEVRSGRIMAPQCLFPTALRHERELGLDFWTARAPRIEGLGVSVAGPEPATGGRTRVVDWLGRLDGCAQSVDRRVKTAGWLDTFAERGGRLVIHAATVSDLDALAGRYDLVLAAVGRGELASLFGRDADRSPPHSTPPRALAVACVHGLGPCPEHPGLDAVRCTLVPGVGELFVVPTLTLSGRADLLLWAGLPDGPLDVFRETTGPGEHLARTLELLERFAPWEYARATEVELTDANATLTAGRHAPTVRHPVARLPSGGLVLGVADTVVADDPVTGQGAGSAAKCAASYLASIVERGERPFDEAWMRTAFDRHWESARHTTRWTNAMLGSLPGHVLDLMAVAATRQPVADRLARGVDDPSELEDFFYDAERAAAYVSSVAEG